jgi:Xaa-Pro dipeptidase
MSIVEDVDRTALGRARRRGEEMGLDAIVASSYESVSHLSGVSIMTQRAIPDRLEIVVLPVDAEPVFLVCNIEEAQVRAESWINDVRIYVEFVETPVVALAKLLRELGLERATLGLELRALNAADHGDLLELIPGATVVGVDAALADLRAIKSPAEITLLSDAALRTDAAIRRAFESAAPGVTERAVASRLAAEVQASADSLAFLAFGAGPSAGIAHPVATDRPLERGDVLRCDVGGQYSGYYSDLARTAVAGAASPALTSDYARLWEAHEEVISQVAPGVPASHLYAVCVKAFERRGLTLNLPHIGHSLGLGLHEAPMLSPFDDTELQEGMMIAVEPAHRDGGPILHVEDLVLVTADGHKVVSRSADWSTLLVCGA